MVAEGFFHGLKLHIEKQGHSLFPHYILEIQDQSIALQPGLKIKIEFKDLFQCQTCQKVVKKLYRGFCYICLTQKAEADLCVLTPHKCHYSQGTCREPEWGEKHCYQPHTLYLSYTGGVKVGLTKSYRIFERWCDQGAQMATEIGYTDSRYHAGLIEQILKKRFALQTNWKKMLQPTDYTKKHFSTDRTEALDLLRAETAAYLLQDGKNKSELHLQVDAPIWSIIYPWSSSEALSIPLQSQNKITRHMCDYEAIQGLKGHYMILERSWIAWHQMEGQYLSVSTLS